MKTANAREPQRPDAGKRGKGPKQGQLSPTLESAARGRPRRRKVRQGAQAEVIEDWEGA